MCYGLGVFRRFFYCFIPSPLDRKNEADDMTRRWMSVVTSDSRFNPGIIPDQSKPIKICKWLHLHSRLER